MAIRGDTAVVVLAAGPGTRMRSDTPKVLHTIAGRSMLSHTLHAITKVAPRHLVVVLGHDHQSIAPMVAELADTLGRTIDVALQDRPLGTGHDWLATGHRGYSLHGQCEREDGEGGRQGRGDTLRVKPQVTRPLVEGENQQSNDKNCDVKEIRRQSQVGKASRYPIQPPAG